MDNNQMMLYMLKNERKRYEYAKELQKTLRWAILSILGAITIMACSYMYFVVPVEEEDLVIDGNNKVVMENTISNGSQVWQ